MLVLSKDDRMGGNAVTDHEVQELNLLLEVCDLHELRSMGPYYSWTNKTVWSRIDRVLINAMWYATFDYTHSQYMPRGLSNHSPILLQFITTPKLVSSF